MTHARYLALALATVATSPLMANELDWRITEASGNVQLLHAGLSKVATRGGIIQPGDTIATGSGSRAVVTRGEEYLMVAPQTQLRLPAAEQSNTVTKLFQDFGNVVFMIKKKMTPHFAVSTPYLAAVVKGTTFSVSVTDTGTSVQVIEGAVDVATADGGAHDLLKPGAVAMVDAMDRFRLRIEGDGAARTITSPAMPRLEMSPRTAPVAPSSPTAAVTPVLVVKSPVRDDVIASPIVEKPVSLAETTDGLVKGTIGGETQVQFALVAEGSRSATDTIHAATVSAQAVEVARVAETKSVEASSVKSEASDAAMAAEKASNAAEQSSKAADDAAAAKAASDAAAATAAADAARAAEQARTAAAEAARAAADVAERQAQQAAAAAAANQAQQAAETASKSGADAATIEAANKASQAAAQQAQRSAEQAAQAEADRLAREAARQEADRQAAKAAAEASQAAQKAQEKAAEQAARDASKVADETARDQAKQLADAAKVAEKAAKDAADHAARDADKAAKEADKAAKDAMKIADAGGSSGPGKNEDGHGKSAKGDTPVDALKDVIAGAKGAKGKN